MLRALNKLSGSVVAAVLYPLKALILAVVFITATLGLALGVLIGLPILFTISAVENAEHKFISGLLTLIISAFALLFVVPIITLALVTIQLFFVVYDFFNSLFFGFKDGFKNGLFFHVLERALFDFAIFNRGLLLVKQGCRPDTTLTHAQESDDEDDNNEPDDFDEEGSNEQVNRTFNALTAAELDAAINIRGLDKVIEQYRDLHERLSVLDAAIARRSPEHEQLDDDVEHGGVEDEVISSMPISNPALLVKKYLSANGVWVVMSTKIIDKDFMETWVNQHDSHPATREVMSRPNPHVVDGVERRTCYRIYPYQTMHDAEELIQCSALIRAAIHEQGLRGDFANVPRKGNAASVINYLRNTLWSPRPPVLDTSSEEKNVDDESYRYG